MWELRSSQWWILIKRVLGCDAVWFSRQVTTFQRNILHASSSTLKRVAAVPPRHSHLSAELQNLNSQKTINFKEMLIIFMSFISTKEIDNKLMLMSKHVVLILVLSLLLRCK